MINLDQLDIKNWIFCCFTYFKTIIENYLSINKNTNDKFILPSDLIVKRVNKENGEISDGQNSIIDYFTKEQLEILDNINRVERIGGIN